MDCIWSFPWEPTKIMSTPPFPDHFWRQSNDVEIQSFVHGCFEGGEFYEFLHVQLDLDVLSKMVRRKTEPQFLDSSRIKNFNGVPDNTP